MTNNFLTLKKINKTIASYGYEVCMGEKYFYFIPLNNNYASLDLGEDNGEPQSDSVYVYRLNHLTLENWINELETKIENLKNNPNYDENNPRWFLPSKQWRKKYE